MVNEFNFRKINSPDTLEDDKFSLMYLKDNELLCVISEEKK